MNTDATRFRALATAIANEDMSFMNRIDEFMGAISLPVYKQLPPSKRLEAFSAAVDHAIKKEEIPAL